MTKTHTANIAIKPSNAPRIAAGVILAGADPETPADAVLDLAS